MTAHAEARPAIQPLPAMSMILLAAAVGHVAIGLATQQMMSGYMDLTPGRLVLELRDAMPFVIAAALVAGWDRWPAGRRWLVAAAIAIAAAGALHAAAQLWFGLNWPPPLSESEHGGVQAFLLPALATLALPLGPLLAAVGLWRAAPRQRHSPRQLAAIAAVAAIAALVVTTWVLMTVVGVRTMSGDVSEPFPGAVIASTVAYNAGAALVAVLGFAAIWAAPRRYFVPEVLIAGGAVAAAIGSILGELVPILVQRQIIDVTWFDWFRWTGYVALLGLLIVALGFFSARISVPGEN